MAAPLPSDPPDAAARAQDAAKAETELARPFTPRECHRSPAWWTELLGLSILTSLMGTCAAPLAGAPTLALVCFALLVVLLHVWNRGIAQTSKIAP